MKSEVVTVKEYQITLSSVEASWLKAVMQNPLWADHPDKEDSFDKEMREKLFNALEWC